MLSEEMACILRGFRYAPATGYCVNPQDADWYYRAIITGDGTVNGQTTYADGYADGDKPTMESWREWADYTGPVFEFTVEATPHGTHADKWIASES